MKASVSFQGQGLFANANGLFINRKGFLVRAGNATTLRKDEGKVYDRKLLEVARKRVRGIADLQAAGLVVPLGGIGAIQSFYEKVSDMTEASVSMDGETRGQSDRPTFDEVGVPIPFVHHDWNLGQRQIEASRQRGEALPTTAMGLATRLVAEKNEDILFNGSSLTVGTSALYGYKTHPSRSIGSLTANWTGATATQIIGDVKAMLQEMKANLQVGPFILYLPTDVSVTLQDDYSSTKGDRTLKERIEAFDEIQKVEFTDALSTGEAVMVSMNDTTVDLAIAQGFTNLEWNNASPMNKAYKVFNVMAPRVKVDVNGNSGVVHYSA